MSNAYLALVLHAHLPFVHHPEYERFLEEDWFYEAITETYVPLLLVCDRLKRDNVHFRLTMSLTPPLLEMLSQPLLQRRYLNYLHKRHELAERESSRRKRSDLERRIAQHYRDRFGEVEAFFRARYGGNLIEAFKELQDEGYLDILGCAATHGLLPLMKTHNAMRAQVAVGMATMQRHLGRRPRGIWLPEMAFRPGLDRILREEGVEYFLVDSHGLLNAYPTPTAGVHAPLCCPSGVAAFGRDLESSKQVWSADSGYPGDGVYREFYRDLGYDADYGDIQPYLHDDGIRRNLGIKYHRVTGQVDLSQKGLYDRQLAESKAREHGGHFVFCRQHQARFLKSQLSCHHIIVAPYDAELFGHWWYEGPEFLEQVFRTAQHTQDDFTLCTLGEYLDRHPPEAAGVPTSSSWGDKGYFEVWLNGSNDWIYRHLHMAEDRMIEMARMFGDAPPTPDIYAALNQAARELLLAQSSDWAFLMTTGTAVPYAEKRTRNHIHRFTRLYQMIKSGNVSPSYVAGLHELNPVFRDVDYRLYL